MQSWTSCLNNTITVANWQRTHIPGMVQSQWKTRFMFGQKCVCGIYVFQQVTDCYLNTLSFPQNYCAWMGQTVALYNAGRFSHVFRTGVDIPPGLKEMPSICSCLEKQLIVWAEVNMVVNSIFWVLSAIYQYIYPMLFPGSPRLLVPDNVLPANWEYYGSPPGTWTQFPKWYSNMTNTPWLQ